MSFFLPTQSPIVVFEASSQVAQEALIASTGDFCLRTDQNKSYILTSTPSSVFSNWTALLSSAGGSGSVTSVSVVTHSGVSGTVANPTTTPAITLTLGAISPSSVTSTFTGGLTGTVTGHSTLDLALAGGTMSGAINLNTNALNPDSDSSLQADGSGNVTVTAGGNLFLHATGIVATWDNILDDGNGNASVGTITIGGVINFGSVAANIAHDNDLGINLIDDLGAVLQWDTDNNGLSVPGNIWMTNNGTLYLNSGALLFDSYFNVTTDGSGNGVVSATSLTIDAPGDYGSGMSIPAGFSVGSLAGTYGLFCPDGANPDQIDIFVNNNLHIQANAVLTLRGASGITIVDATTFSSPILVNDASSFASGASAIDAYGVFHTGESLVNALPSGTDGDQYYAANGCKPGELTGFGTGVQCQYYAAVSAWCIMNYYPLTPVTS